MDRGLAPRGIGALLDGAIDLYRRGWKPLAAASLIVAGPAALVVSIAQVFYMRGYLEFLPTIRDWRSGIDPESFRQLMLPSTLSSTVSPLYWLATMFVAACVYASAPALQAGETLTLRDVFRAGRGRYVHLLGVSVLSLMAVEATYIVSALAGMIPVIVFALLSPLTMWVTIPLYVVLLLVPAPYVACRLALAPSVTVLEGAGVVDSIRRSWRLTAHRWGRVLGFFICFSLISFAVQGALNSPAAVRQLVDSIRDPQAIFRELSWGWKAFEGLLSATSVSLALPFTHLAWYGLYVDTRARAEGMDLLARARALTAAKGTEAA